MLLWRTSDLLPAQPPQVLLADARDSRQLGQRPRIRKIRLHPLPHPPQAVVFPVRLGENQHIMLNQLAPVVQRRWRNAIRPAFGVQSHDCRPQRSGIIHPRDRRNRRHDRPVLARLKVSHVCELPRFPHHRPQAVRHKRRQQTRLTTLDFLPHPVGHHFPGPLETCQHECAGLLATQDFKILLRLDHPDMGDVMLRQQRTQPTLP